MFLRVPEQFINVLLDIIIQGFRDMFFYEFILHLFTADKHVLFPFVDPVVPKIPVEQIRELQFFTEVPDCVLLRKKTAALFRIFNNFDPDPFITDLNTLHYSLNITDQFMLHKQHCE